MTKKKPGKSWGVGGSTTDPLEWKFQRGGGGLKLNDHPWGGMDIFWKHTLLKLCLKTVCWDLIYMDYEKFVL